MARVPSALTAGEVAFLAERHLATLTTLRADGSPHVVPVGFSYDAATATARVICSDGTQKVRNVEATGLLGPVGPVGPVGSVVLCQTVGADWLSLVGRGTVHRSSEAIAEGEARYASRYQAPAPNPHRVVIEIAVTQVLGRVRDRER